MAVSQDYVTWTCGPQLDAWYLYHFLQSRKADLARIAFGNTIKTIGLDYFRHLTIALPPICEQQEIARALCSADNLISLLEKLIIKKQAVKQGMMQQLLAGRIRLPGYRTDWSPQVLGSVLDRLEAGVSVNSVTDHGEFCILKTSCVTSGEFDALERKTVAPSDLNRVKVSPQADSLIVSRMNTPALVGEVGYVDADYPSLFLPDRLWLATKRSASHVNMRWLAYALSSDLYREQLREVATGTSVTSQAPC